MRELLMAHHKMWWCAPTMHVVVCRLSSVLSHLRFCKESQPATWMVDGAKPWLALESER